MIRNYEHHVAASIEQQSRIEIPSESLGLDQTASNVVLTVSHNADLKVFIAATQGNLQITDGSVAQNSSCLESDGESYSCSHI